MQKDHPNEPKDSEPDSSDIPEDTDEDLSDGISDEQIAGASGDQENDDSNIEEESSDNDSEDEKVEMEEEEDLAAVLGSTKGKELLEVPSDINCDSPLVDLQFHPEESSSLLALATLDGEVLMYKYDVEENTLKQTLKPHQKSCRGVRFSEKGDHIYSISKDGGIAVTDLETEKQVHVINGAHEASIYSMAVLGTNFLATGDDDGAVKVWDLRKQEAVSSWNDMEDYITSMVVDDARRTLVCASGDGTITAYNVKARKKMVQSEEYDYEPTCLARVRCGTKLAMGTSGKKNPIYFFNWNEFGYHSDRLSGHPTGMTCMVAATEKILVTGDDYGTLRAVHIFPHRFLGVVGRHSGGFGIENLALSPNNEYIASCGQDQKVSFWNLEYLQDMEKSSFRKRKGKIRLKNLPSSRQQNVTDFFADLREDEDE